MSRFEAMHIQGIRSFGPDYEDRGEIRFFRPLTLIMGQNGCGKTTIIEALKYACTGEMPPGSQRGQSFVHDPSILGEVTVRAKVSLLFRNVRGQNMLSVRVMEATQKAATISVKTCDNTLSKLLADGSSVNINKKCADMDLEVFAAIGVTKPILNHVIFCHQEESSWPLDEGKKLKERFDAIFDSTDYLNCIKKIKDHAKALRSDQNVKKMEAVAAQKDFTEAQRLRQEIREENERLSKSEKQVAQSSEELKTISERLAELRQKEQQMATVEAERCRALTVLAETERACNELQLSTERVGAWRPPQGDDVSDEQLEQLLAEMNSGVEHRQMEMQRDQSELASVERQLQQLADRENLLNVEIGKLEAAEERVRQTRRERDVLVRRSAQLYGSGESQLSSLLSTAPDCELSEKCVRVVVGCVRQGVRDAESRLQRAIESRSAEASQAQERLDSVRCRQTKLEADISHCYQQIKNNDAELEEKRQLLTEARGSAAKMQEIDVQLASIEAKYNAAVSELNIEALSEQNTQDEQQIECLETQIQNIQDEKNKMLSSAALRKELDLHKEQIDKKRAEVERLISENASNFQTVGVDMESTSKAGLSDVLQKRYTQLVVATNKKEAESKRLQRQLNNAEVNERQARDLVASLERELAAEEAELFTTLQSADLEEELSVAAASARDLEKSYGHLSAMQHFYTRYIDKLTPSGAGRNSEATVPCPLCHRQFEHASEPAQLVVELRRLIETLPADISATDVKKQRARARHDDLLTLRPKQERVNRLRDVDLPAAKQRLQTAVDELARIGDQQRRIQRELSEQERCRRCAEQLRADCSRIDERRADIERLIAEKSRVSAQLPLSFNSAVKTVEQLDSELNDQRQLLVTTRSRLRDSEKRIRGQRQLLADLGDEKHNVRSRRLQLQKLHADQQQLTERSQQLAESNKQLSDELRELKSQVAAVIKQVEVESAAREKIATDGQEAEEKCRRHLDNVQSDFRKLEAAQQQLASQERADSGQQLLTVREQLRQLVDEAGERRQRTSRIRDAIDEVQQLLRSQETRQRDIRDFQQLRIRRREVLDLRTTCEQAERRLSEFDGEQMAADRRTLEKRHCRLSELVFGEKGAQEQMRSVLASRTAKLSSPQFSDADKIYRKCQVENCCLRLAEKDITLYAKALDDALISFHAERMAQINELICELWRSCYCGNDIDYIAIRTDNCGSGGASRRTTYNYRVVMIRNDREMDMRGRCSAGQKVLACLIIRMALAETFGTNCGMLTLDEPTTNLDHENVERLAEALAEIVAKRSAQSNFQLVIITHDSVFLDILSRSEHLKKYYRVWRKPSGLSEIKLVDKGDVTY